MNLIFNFQLPISKKEEFGFKILDIEVIILVTWSLLQVMLKYPGMISVTELRSGRTFKLDGQLWLVLKYEHIKMARGSGNIKVKVRSLDSGTVTEKSFITGAKVEPVDVQQRESTFLYSSGDQLVFMNSKTFEQFEIDQEMLGDQAKFLQEGSVVKVLFTMDENSRPVNVDLPPKMTFEVVEADPGVKGDSAANMLKNVKLSNGMSLKAPLFIKQGESIVVDTRTGEYVERAK